MEIKTIHLPTPPSKKKEKPLPKKRIITETTKWHDYLDENLDVEPQWSMLIALSQEYNIPVPIDDLSRYAILKLRTAHSSSS